MGLRDYKGGAGPLTLKTALGPTDTSFDVDIILGDWPSGSPAGDLPFFIVIDRGSLTEEKLLISHRSGTTFTVLAGGRGADDTTAANHSSGAIVEHVWSATDAREANQHVNRATGVHGLSALDRVIGSAELATELAKKVAKAGDTLTGPLTLAGDAAADLNAVPKRQLDAVVAAAVAAEAQIRATADQAEATARANADTAHTSAPDPHPQYLTPAEGSAAFVDVVGDTMTGPLVIDTPSGSGVGLTLKRNNAAIEFWSPSSEADSRRWRQVVSDTDGNLYWGTLKDDGSGLKQVLTADNDGGAWFNQLPPTVRAWNSSGSLEHTGANGSWANLPGVHNLTAQITLPHRALCLVEFGAWMTLDPPTSGSGYFALSFVLGGATVQGDPLHGATWGLVPRAVVRPSGAASAGTAHVHGTDSDETSNGSRMVLLEAGTTNVQLKAIKNYAPAQASTVKAYVAYSMLQVTPIRFVA